MIDSQKKIPKPPSDIIIFSILLAWSNGLLEKYNSEKKYKFLNYKNDDINQVISRSELMKNSYKILHMFGWVKRYPDFFKSSSFEKIHWRGKFSTEFSSFLGAFLKTKYKIARFAINRKTINIISKLSIITTIYFLNLLSSLVFFCLSRSI